MGRTRSYAERINLAATAPHDELASTQFCLAEPGRQYLVYLPQGGEVTVNLSGGLGMLNVEWMRPADGIVARDGAIAGGQQQVMKAPFTGDAVLYLWCD